MSDLIFPIFFMAVNLFVCAFAFYSQNKLRKMYLKSLEDVNKELREILRNGK